MKLKFFVMGLISAAALVMTSGYAAAAGDQPSDPAMQQESQGSGGQEEGQASGGQQMSSDTIKQVQSALNQQGYDVGSADGKFGSKTQEAIKKFQEDKGMQASGQLDQQTLAALGVDAGGAAAGGGAQDDAASQPSSPDMESGSGAGGQSDMGSSPDTMSPSSPPSSGPAGPSSDPGSIPGQNSGQ